MNKAPAGQGNLPVPDVTLERYVLGEIDATARQQLEARMREDPALRARVDVLMEADTAARADYPPAVLAAEVRKRCPLHERGGVWPRNLGWLIPIGGAVALAFVVARGEPVQNNRGADLSAEAAHEDGRAKGADATLLVYRNGAAGATPVVDGGWVAPGDVVRVGYRVARPGFGAIVSVDGRGVVTQHFPEAGDRAAALEAGGLVLLDRGFELDDAPRVERFFLVTAPEPFDLAPVCDLVRRVGDGPAVDIASLGLAPSFTASVFTLKKDVRP